MLGNVFGLNHIGVKHRIAEGGSFNALLCTLFFYILYVVPDKRGEAELVVDAVLLEYTDGNRGYLAVRPLDLNIVHYFFVVLQGFDALFEGRDLLSSRGLIYVAAQLLCCQVP